VRKALDAVARSWHISTALPTEIPEGPQSIWTRIEPTDPCQSHTVVRQYSRSSANHVANTLRTERRVGLARTLNGSIVLRVETQNCNRPSTRGQIDFALPSVANPPDSQADDSGIYTPSATLSLGLATPPYRRGFERPGACSGRCSDGSGRYRSRPADERESPEIVRRREGTT
jgi:hypothetical protein